jgi:hypothetical protein
MHFKDITSKKVQPWHHQAATPPSARFYCCFRPPEGRRIQMHCVLQSAVVPARIPISFRSPAIQSAGRGWVL